MHSTYLTGVELILSSTAQSGKPTECITIKNGIETYVESLKVQIEQPDVRTVSHAINATEHGYQRIVLLSSDTDVMVLGLYIRNRMSRNGLQELWVCVGVRNTIHSSSSNSREKYIAYPCVTFSTCFTGCDSTSKVGTKLSAVKLRPEVFLTDFGQVIANTPDDIIMKA